MTRSQALYERIADLTRDGMSAPEIAGHLHITTRTVQRGRVAMGVAKPPPRQLTLAERQTIGDMLRDGASYPEVARTVGRHANVIRRAFPGFTYTPDQAATARSLGKAMAQLDRNIKPHNTPMKGTTTP